MNTKSQMIQFWSDLIDILSEIFSQFLTVKTTITRALKIIKGLNVTRSRL